MPGINSAGRCRDLGSGRETVPWAIVGPPALPFVAGLPRPMPFRQIPPSPGRRLGRHDCRRLMARGPVGSTLGGPAAVHSHVVHHQWTTAPGCHTCGHLASLLQSPEAALFDRRDARKHQIGIHDNGGVQTHERAHRADRRDATSVVLDHRSTCAYSPLITGPNWSLQLPPRLCRTGSNDAPKLSRYLTMVRAE